MMKNYFKPLLASLVAMLMAVRVNAEVYSGTCGDNLTWELNTATGVLSIDGTGHMKDYGYSGSNYVYKTTAPWGKYINDIKSLTVGNNVTSIGFAAFYGCTGLTSVTIPESVTSIGSYVFSGCTGLTKPVYNKKIFAKLPTSYQGDYTIPSGIETIAGGAFSGCSGLTSITIPESVTSIGVYAFSGCSGLTSVTIPESVTSIGEYAFSGCSGLTSVTIPESVTSIGEYAFSGCSGLTEPVYNKKLFALLPASYQGDYVIPDGIETICDGAFLGCSGLTAITIPSSVMNIGRRAFYRCTGLTTISLPSSVTSIGDGAFLACTGLTEPVYNKKLFAHLPTSYQGDYVIPKGIVSICNYAFGNCTGLTSLTIPESVTSIGEYAFSGCTGIKTVNALSATPPTAAANSFDGVYNTAFLYVPLGCEEAYGTAEGWSSFAKLREKDFGTKDCLLTLKGFNGGCVALKCKTRSTYAFQIKAEEGWKVSSLTFNGTDATGSIASDGSYTTPSLTDDSEICVVFEEEGSAVGEISTEDVLRVSASGNVLSVQNEGEAVQATIFTTDGRQVKAIEAKRGTTQVRLAEGQVYLVKIGGRTFKVAM